jgi:hypothetical protein
MGSFPKKTGKPSDGFLNKVIQQVKHESTEMLKTAKKQLLGSELNKSADSTNLVNEILSAGKNTGVLSPEQKRALDARARQRISDLQNELRQIRMKRAESEANQQRAVDDQREKSVTDSGKRPVELFPIPSGKRRVNIFSFFGRKKASYLLESGRQRKG